MKKFGRNLLVALMLAGSIGAYAQTTSTSNPSPSDTVGGTDPMPPVPPSTPPPSSSTSSDIVTIALNWIAVLV